MSLALIDKAARAESRATGRGLLESGFAHMFTSFVYPQIWEDPLVDMEALGIGPHSRIAAIASGGCNVMSYLTRNPARVVAVDLNPAHLALLDLKRVAARHVRNHAEFFRLFGNAGHPDNVRLYDAVLADLILPESREFWSSRSISGRRRIHALRTGLYRQGLLGRSMTLAHWICRLHGAKPASLLQARNHEELRAAYDREIRPIFESALVRLLFRLPVSVFGLGIPPRQYDALTEDHPDEPHKVLAERTERLLTAFAPDENYFAHQALTHSYGRSLPPYLEAEHFATLGRAVQALELHNASITDILDRQPAGSLDGFVLLDAQDWMNGEQLNDLWRAISRAAAPGARFVFRTAGRQLPAFDRLTVASLARWQRLVELGDRLHARDRSGIYGALHVYECTG